MMTIAKADPTQQHTVEIAFTKKRPSAAVPEMASIAA